jgi:hypothetical protein
MSTTNKLKLVEMLRLRADKNVTRSKMYIKAPDGGYMKRKNPQTNEEEYYTLKRLLLDIKYRAIHNYQGAERSLNEYLIRIVFNHEIVMKSALKSIRDPGHEEAIDAIHRYLSQNHASSLHNTSSLPLKSKIMKEFNVILKKKYHKTTYLDDSDTYIQEDKLIRENDIQLEDINHVGREDNSIFLINPAIDIYGNMKKIYVNLQDVLLQYSGNDIIFNKYTVTGRDGGKGKMNSFEEESKKIIETIQTLEADYKYYLSDFESRAKEIMRQIHIRLKSKNPETMRKKQFLHGVMLSLGENIKILDHYIKIFFNQIYLLSKSVKDAIRKQNEKSKVSPKGYGPRASPTFSSISSEKPKAKEEEEEDDFYKGMNMLSLSPTNEAEKKPPAVPVADIKRLSPPTITTNKTRKNKKKKKKKKNKTKKSSGENENIDDLIGEYQAKDLRKLDSEIERLKKENQKLTQSEIEEEKVLIAKQEARVEKRLKYYGLEKKKFKAIPGYIGNYSIDATDNVSPHGFGYITYPRKNKAGLINYIGSWKEGKVHGFGQLAYNYKNPRVKGIKKFVYRGNFTKNRRYGEGKIYTFDDGKLYKQGVFLEEEGAWDKLSTLDNERVHFIPQEVWGILKKYYWLLRLYFGTEGKLFKSFAPYDILKEIQDMGKLPKAHHSTDNDELLRGRNEVIMFMGKFLKNMYRNKCQEDCDFIINGTLTLLEQSYICYLIIALQINKKPKHFENIKEESSWWKENIYGVNSFRTLNKDRSNLMDYYQDHPVLTSQFSHILDRKGIFQLDKFSEEYYSHIAMGTEISIIDIQSNLLLYSFYNLPMPPSPLVETISGRRVNIFDESDISLLGRNAANIDKLLEHEVGMFLAGEKTIQAEVNVQKLERNLDKASGKLLKALEKAKPSDLEGMKPVSPKIHAQLARDRLMMKNKRTSDMILKNLDNLLLTKKIAKDKFKLDLSNKIDSIIDEWNYHAEYNMGRDAEWIKRTYENPEEAIETLEKEQKIFQQFYRKSLETLLDVEKIMDETEEKIRSRKIVKVKKKGGRRTRKKRGSSRAEVCSQLLQRLKMINDQIELGGFDINELKKDGMDTLKILQQCLKDGLIDVTEYMKIKMEYENYFKQY